MHISLFCDYGQYEVGTGHFYRLREIANNLKNRGHLVTWAKENLSNNIDVLIIDHIHSQSKRIKMAKNKGIKVVLLDGDKKDVRFADVTISPIYNPKANYKGRKYFAIPKKSYDEGYRVGKKSNTIFVAMGGLDANSLAPRVVETIKELNLNAIVAKSINHDNLKDQYNNITIYKDDNYYDPMHECIMGVTNGGLSMIQALHFGLPTIAIPQYDHQKNNIRMFEEGCIESNMYNLKRNIISLLNSEYKRESLSRFASYYIDGKGTDRICDIIEDLV